MSPRPIDREVVRRHLTAIDAAVQRLRRFHFDTAAQLARDTEARWAVERGLQLCAQNALDIATHLVAAAGEDAPDYASALDALARIGVLPADFAERFRGIAGFRNVLVHAYLDVDLDVVLRLLRGGLDDFSQYARHVEVYLDRNA